MEERSAEAARDHAADDDVPVETDCHHNAVRPVLEVRQTKDGAGDDERKHDEEANTHRQRLHHPTRESLRGVLHDAGKVEAA